MNLIKQPVAGSLLASDELHILKLDNSEPENKVFLSYAVITHGPELHVLPSILLDDWGKEITGLALYRWIEENGHSFPRAEIFGVDPAGAKVQYFLRDLELTANYPLYAFQRNSDPLQSSVLINAIVVPDAAIDEPQRMAPPSDIEWPLWKAAVQWWRVNYQLSDPISALRQHK